MSTTMQALITTRQAVHRWQLYERSGKTRAARESGGGCAGQARTRSLRLLREGLGNSRMDFIKAEVVARRVRGKLLESIRAELGGSDFPIVVVESVVSQHGYLYSREGLVKLSGIFEGAAFIVRKGPYGFDHADSSTKPWPMPGDAKREAGFVHGLHLGTVPIEGSPHGRVALVGSLHVYGDEVDVRALIHKRHVSGKIAGLSIETPAPPSASTPAGRGDPGGPLDIARVRMLDFYEEGGAESFCAVCFVDRPAIGGRILPPGTSFTEARAVSPIRLEPQIRRST